jgi:hypothetical protein
MQTRQLTRMPLTARPRVAHPVTTHGNETVHASPYRETVDPGARVRADGRMTRAGSELLALQRRYGNRHVQRLIEQHRNRADGDLRHTSAGRRLPDNMRSTMERAFGTDLHEVRLHEGPAASTVGALAYTQGTDIHFGPGEYQPHTPYGRALIGHELTHVVQQRRGRVAAPLGAGMPINDDARLEGEAHELGLRAAHGRTVNVTSDGSGRPPGDGPAPIQRTPKWLKQILRAVGIMAPHPAGGGGALPAPATALDEFVAAYENARYYHGTALPENARSIHQHGLLTHADRQRVLGGDVVGMSLRRAREFGGDEKKGVYMGPRTFMEEEAATIPENLVRLYLPYSRTANIRNPHDFHGGDPEDLVRDINFPGAFISKQSIPAGQTYFGKMSQAGDERLASILQAVATHYPEDSQPSLEEMEALLRQAIKQRRLSDVPLDIPGRGARPQPIRGTPDLVDALF